MDPADHPSPFSIRAEWSKARRNGPLLSTRSDDDDGGRGCGRRHRSGSSSSVLLLICLSNVDTVISMSLQ